MSADMYAELIVSELSNAAKDESQPVTFSNPIVGTLSGGDVITDAFGPIPYSDFSLMVDDRTTTKPVYQNGDRLVIVPANDGKQLIIIGRLI